MAVMLNNIKAGTPQAGLAEASVIYEAPMEGADVTRLMPLFENWQDMGRSDMSAAAAIIRIYGDGV